ncbi:uncharacterized protein LOC101240776 isoform X2 [Hydra vulgaris]|uniref:uncharacterized protein LOC101240776 isoform X2 n=1 Tax=Hydra vulgaris TaxID=6087 RepID=UPI001F5EE1EF|nr:uncharacterized protein LOC101240776 isoform X2 [Hydra vulgaris]
MKLKWFLTIATITFLSLGVFAYSGESEDSSVVESELSGEYDAYTSSRNENCQKKSRENFFELNNENQKCSLTSAFRLMDFGEMDSDIRLFLKPNAHSFKCEKLTINGNRKSIVCNAPQFTALPRGKGTFLLLDVELTLSANDSSYKNLELVIINKNPHYATINKKAGSKELKLDYQTYVENIQRFLKLHFGFEYGTLKTIQSFNKYFPDIFSELKLTASFSPNYDFVEIIFGDTDHHNKFFIYQQFASSASYSIGFFKIVENHSINEALNTQINEDYLPIMKKSQSSCFTSCSSEITMIMNAEYRNLTKNCITEGSSVVMPEGVTLRWRKNGHNNIKIAAGKDNGIVDELKNDIGFSALFLQENDIITAKVTTYDNITSNLEKILNYFLPLTPPSIPAADLFKSVLQKSVVFQMVIIRQGTVSLQCTLVEDWSIAKGLISLNGINLTLSVPFNNWSPIIISGSGEILVLGEMIEIKIEKAQDKDEYFLTADYNINNISALATAANDIEFLPDDDEYRKLESLKTLPLSSLYLKIKLNSEVLKFLGTSLSYANVSDKGVSNFSTLEIVLYNKDNSASMVVGICQELVSFEKFIKEVLDINLEGVPWLTFEKFCFLVAKEEDSIIKQHFNTEMYPLLKKGIGYKGRISYNNIVCQTTMKSGEDTQVLNNYEDMCNFIKNKTNDFMKFIGGEGSISQSLFTFTTIVNTDQTVVFDIGSLQMKNPSFSLKEVYQYTYNVIEKSPKIATPNTRQTKLQKHNRHNYRRSRNNIVHSGETQNVEKISSTRVFGVVIEGDVKDTSTNFECKGAISSYESGQLILNCVDAKISISYSEITNFPNSDKDVLFKASQGKSVAINNVFSVFEFHSKMTVIYENRVMKIEDGSLTLNLLNMSHTYFSAELKDVSDFKTILIKFQMIKNFKPLPTYIFSGSKFYESALLVWSGKDSVIAAASNRTAQASVLTLFGSVNRSSSAVDFVMIAKKCYARYVEWLPVMNVSNSKFIVYKKKKSSVGPKLQLEWNWCQCNKNSNNCNKGIKSINISGKIETIGISDKIEIILNKHGHFETSMNKYLFFNEAQAFISIKQVTDLEALNDINPQLHVNLIQDDETKFYIKDTVESHFKTLANEFVSLYNGNSFPLINIKAEDLLYHPTKKIIDAIKPINNMISDQILAIESIDKVMSKDCVEECVASPVNIPGIVTQQNSEGISFKWLPNNQRAINVSCVTDCEIIKSNQNENLDDKINNIKKEVIIYDKLVGEAKELTDFYSIFEETTKSSSTAFDSNKKKFEQLFNLLNKDINGDFFKIEKFEINANVADIMVLGSNCVQNFKATYTMFNQPKEFSFCQCFNGEYATYFANKVVENYLGDEFPNLKAFYEFHDSYVVKQEVYYKSLEDNLTNFYEKYGNVHEEEVEESPSQRFTVQFNDSLLDSSEVLKFHTKKLYLPLLTQSKRGLLDENHYAITRSIKTRKAFLYSSPWAALSVFDLENSLKGAQLAVRALPTNKSHCHAVSESGNQYIGLYSSIRSISDSYSQTKDQLSLIHQSMRNETNVLKRYTVGSSSETKIDQLYWIRQLERGTQLFYDLMQKKLSTYSSHALAAFKTKFERALKRNGFLNISRFIKKLKEQVQTASRSVKKQTSGMAAVSRLSEAIVALFSKPNQKLDLVANRIKEMEKYVMNINGMVRTCKH